MRSGMSAVAVIIIIASTLDIEAGDQNENVREEIESGDASPARYVVLFSEEIRFRSLNEDLARTCGASGKVRGCTEFPSESLSCDCYRDGAGWRLRIRARVDAVMHVDHASIVTHERHHLRHLDDLLSDYLEKMTAPLFATETRCRALAHILSRPEYVMAMMNELRMSSNDLFQCSRPGQGRRHPEGLLAFEDVQGGSATRTAR